MSIYGRPRYRAATSFIFVDEKSKVAPRFRAFSVVVLVRDATLFYCPFSVGALFYNALVITHYTLAHNVYQGVIE